MNEKKYETEKEQQGLCEDLKYSEHCCDHYGEEERIGQMIQEYC